MIPQETLEQTFKEIEKAPTAEALEQLLCLILQERMGLSKIALSKFKKEVQAVIIYVNAHYMDKLTLDGIADYVGLNREIEPPVLQRDRHRSVPVHQRSAHETRR